MPLGVDVLGHIVKDDHIHNLGIDGHPVGHENHVHKTNTPMPFFGIGVKHRKLGRTCRGYLQGVFIATGVPNGAIQVDAVQIDGCGRGGLGIDPRNREGGTLGETEGRRSHRALELAQCQPARLGLDDTGRIPATRRQNLGITSPSIKPGLALRLESWEAGSRVWGEGRYFGYDTSDDIGRNGK